MITIPFGSRRGTLSPNSRDEEEANSASTQQSRQGFVKQVFRHCDDDKSEGFVDVIAIFVAESTGSDDLRDNVFLYRPDSRAPASVDETTSKRVPKFLIRRRGIGSPPTHQQPPTSTTVPDGHAGGHADDYPEGFAKDTNWMIDKGMLSTAFPKANITGYRINAFGAKPKSSPKKRLERLVSCISKDIILSRESRLQKPIVFVGHGYGCIVIDKILFTDGHAGLNEEEENSQLALSTAALFLFGAPLLDSANLKKYLKKTQPLSGSDVNAYLEETTNNFEQWQKHFRQAADNRISVFLFCEQDSPRSGNDEREKKTFKSFEDVTVRPTPWDISTVGKMSGSQTKRFRDLQTWMSDALWLHQLSTAVEDANADELLQSLISNPPRSLNVQNSRGQTILHICAIRGLHKAMSQLLKHDGADVDHQDKLGRTALHIVVRDDSSPGRFMAEDLLRAGANPSLKDKNGKSPVQLSEGGMKTMLMEQDYVVEGRAESRLKSLVLGSPTNHYAQKACEETTMVIRNVYAAGENDSLSDAHVPLYYTVNDFIYSSKGIDGILQGMGLPPTPECREPKMTCRWFHVPMNNMAWIHDLFAKLDYQFWPWPGPPRPSNLPHGRCMHPQSVKLEHFAVGEPGTKNEAWVIMMPYISYQHAIQQWQLEEKIRSPNEDIGFDEDLSPREMPSAQISLADNFAEALAIRGYMNDERQGERYSLRLQARRTLDQSYYYMLNDTTHRDRDQVVSRWAYSKRQDPKEKDPHNILMVDQLWLWMIKGSDESEPDTIISSFPSRTGAKPGRLDHIQGNVLKKSADRMPILRSADVVSRILTLCCKTLDRHQSSESLQFLDFFETAIGHAEEDETALFNNFCKTTEHLYALHEKHVDYQLHRKRLLKNLLVIQKDTQLLAEVKDIQDELKMIDAVIDDQLEAMRDVRKCSWPEGNAMVTYAEECLKDTQTTIKSLQSHAHSVEEELKGLLDLKQKQANLWEAKSSREGAEETAKQGSTIFIFTVVTIVFLPLSFMTSFLALGISSFPKTNGENDWPLGYVLGLLFGVSFALIIPLGLVAINIQRAKRLWKCFKIGATSFIAFFVLKPLSKSYSRYYQRHAGWIATVCRMLIWLIYGTLVEWIVKRFLPRKPDTQSRQEINSALSDPVLVFEWEGSDSEEAEQEMESKQRLRKKLLLSQIS